MPSSDATSSAAPCLAPLVTESRSPFTFKLDHIKRVDSTTNYLSLRNQISIYLPVMDIYKSVDESTHKPGDTTHLATCTRNACTAKAAIMSFLSEGFMHLASDAPPAKNA